METELANGLDIRNKGGEKGSFKDKKHFRSKKLGGCFLVSWF